MSIVTGVLIDTVNRKASIHTVNSDTLQAYYDILNCNTFDIATRKIGKKYYDIFCDDEGLYQSNPVVSALSANGEPMLVGNLFVTRTDSNGETISLSLGEIREVMEHTIHLTNDKNETWIAVVCDY